LQYNWPNALKFIKNENKDLAVGALGMTIAFLEDSMLAEETLKTGEFSLLE
jgi:hypothetical protein